MRKKIILIVVWLCSMFSFLCVGYADSSLSEGDGAHELMYDIEKMYFSDSTIIFEGWAFLHNYHNFGSDLSSKSYDNMVVNTLHKKNVDIEIYLADSEGNNRIGNFSISSYRPNDKPIDLTDWMCTRKNNLCGNSSVYYDVGFKASINLNALNISDYSKDYFVWLSYSVIDSTGKTQTCSDCKSGAKQISVVTDSGVYNEKEVPDNVKIKGLSKSVIQVAVTANKLGPCGTFSKDCGGSGGDDWDFEGSYVFDEVIRKQDKCPDGDEPYTKYEYPIRLYRLGTYYATAGWVTGSGSISIKFEKNVAVCKKTVLTKSKVLNNCDSAVNYYCGEMTVKASDGRSANISISENVSIDSSDTFLKTIIAGKGFEYNVTYIDTVSWKKVSGNLTDAEINSLFNGTYYVYNKNEMEKKLNEDKAIKDGLNMNIYDKYKEPNFSEAGSWSCNDVVISGNTYTAICNYKIKIASINRQTGLITGYSDTVDNNSLDGGNRYYIPLKYFDKVFKWKIQTDSGNSLSLLHVSSNKDDLTKLESPKIYIDTGDFEEKNVLSNNMCYINVKNDFYDVEDNGSSKEIKGLKFVYRSISINNPFPSNRTMPQNWQIYSDDHSGLKRLEDSYDNLVYVTEKNIRSTLSGEYDYWDKSDVDKDGKVDIVDKDNKYINKKIYSVEERHCKLGEFVDGKCDTR